MKKLINNIDKFVEYFYRDFFENNKEIEAVFHNTDLKLQKDEMKSGLLRIIGKIDDPKNLNLYLQDLGVRHISYEVQPKHYVEVKESLLRSFKFIYESEWNEEREEEIRDLINHICEQMIIGAQSLEKGVA